MESKREPLEVPLLCGKCGTRLGAVRIERPAVAIAIGQRAPRPEHTFERRATVPISPAVQLDCGKCRSAPRVKAAKLVEEAERGLARGLGATAQAAKRETEQAQADLEPVLRREVTRQVSDPCAPGLLGRLERSDRDAAARWALVADIARGCRAALVARGASAPRGLQELNAAAGSYCLVTRARVLAGLPGLPLPVTEIKVYADRVESTVRPGTSEADWSRHFRLAYGRAAARDRWGSFPTPGYDALASLWGRVEDACASLGLDAWRCSHEELLDGLVTALRSGAISSNDLARVSAHLEPYRRVAGHPWPSEDRLRDQRREVRRRAAELGPADRQTDRQANGHPSSSVVVD